MKKVIGAADGDTLHGAADGSAHPFRGNFNGNSHVISNMDIEGSYIAAGLFGNVGSSDMDDIGSADAVLLTQRDRRRV